MPQGLDAGTAGLLDEEFMLLLKQNEETHTHTLKLVLYFICNCL